MGKGCFMVSDTYSNFMISNSKMLICVMMRVRPVCHLFILHSQKKTYTWNMRWADICDKKATTSKQKKEEKKKEEILK